LIRIDNQAETKQPHNHTKLKSLPVKFINYIKYIPDLERVAALRPAHRIHEPAKLWGAQTQRSLEHFSIGHDLIPREMITAYAILKKAAAEANHAGGRLPDVPHKLITQICDEVLAGQHHDMFPLHVWMTGSGTQFNMNVNEVISNRSCQIVGTPLGSKRPVHPNDHVNMAQSSNDSFPPAMYIATAVNVTGRLVPAVKSLRDSISAKAEDWKDIVKIGRTQGR
jgi:fumarate hydratase class II